MNGLRVKKPFEMHPHRAELWRWAFLSGVAIWLLHPFATSRMIGTGDALWYAQMLADFVTQIRDGHFPVFVGQTEWAWNGAVYPLRVAPLYQHLGAAIDVLTGRQLGFFALQHAIVIVSGSLGLISAYLCLRAIDPASPWRAAVLAALYLSCPGVLGTIYTQDLYMTWTVLPFPPLVLAGTVRTFREDDLVAQLGLSGGLAGAWLAHAPIALWLTLIATFVQAVRLLSLHRRLASWRTAACGVGAFILLGTYPFISVWLLQVPGTDGVVVTDSLANDQQIIQAVRSVFPRVLLPLSPAATVLSDLQLGYGLWLVAIVAVILAARRGAAVPDRWLMILLLVAAALLLALLLPIPLINEWLWDHVPGEVKRITFYWPMHRFYVLLAVLLTGTIQLGSAGIKPRWATLVLTATSLALTWSLWESRQFVRAGRERTATADRSAQALRPENRLLMNHSYGLFAALPDHFTNGATDPRAEFRLLDATGNTILSATNSEPFVAVVGRIDSNPGILRLDHGLTLAPGERYALDFRFRDRNYHGILQLIGSTFFREYQLPHSGSARAFGSTEGASSTLNLWTTSARSEQIAVRYIPTDPAVKPWDFRQFGELRLRRIVPDREPLEVVTLSPLKVRTRAPAPAVLATPRMALAGYVATIDGAPSVVRTAHDGTLQIPVPPGEHVVAIDYTPHAGVLVSYFVTLASWLVLCAGAMAFRVRRGWQGAATR
jgi:hypothetical protein